MAREIKLFAGDEVEEFLSVLGWGGKVIAEVSEEGEISQKFNNSDAVHTCCVQSFMADQKFKTSTER